MNTIYRGIRNLVRSLLHSLLRRIAALGQSDDSRNWGGQLFQLRQVGQHRWFDLKPWLDMDRIPETELHNSVAMTAFIVTRSLNIPRWRLWLAAR